MIRFKSKNRSKQRGMATVDLMLYLVGIAILLAWVGSLAADMWTDFKVTRFNAAVDTISKAANEKYGMKAGFTGLSMDNLEEILPDEIGDGQGTNIFGGDYTAAVGTTVRTYRICGNSIESKAGYKIAAKWRNASYTDSTETACVIFGS